MPRGGKREGAGRKTKDGSKPDTVFQLKLESAQKDRLLELGGAEYVRWAVDTKKVNDLYAAHKKINPPNT